MFDKIKEMHKHFGIAYNGEPRELPEKEMQFRLTAFNEEIDEYIKGVENGDIEDQFDALLDLLVFTLGALEQHGFDAEAGFKRVMAANMAKRLVNSVDESKRGHGTDLIKPEGWREPYLGDLIKPKCKVTGIIILEGPDGSGKTTLADYLVDTYDAHYIHSTYSEEIGKDMAGYMRRSMEIAKEISHRQLVILDRHWLSTLVYADVFREGADVDADLSRDAHIFLLDLRDTTLVYCLPGDKNRYFADFDKLKDEREEMYSSVKGVYYAYEALWYGDSKSYIFKNWTKYHESLALEGGFRNHEHAIRYDLHKFNNDISSFCSKFIGNHYG